MLYRDYLKDKYQSTALKTAYAEGFPCVLESSKGKNIRNYEVYGNSVQDGVPTPESPVEIQSVGDLVTDTESEYYGKYDIPITVCGKNLLPYPYYYNSRTLNGITFAIYDDGTIILNGTGEFDTVRIVDFILLRKSDISAGTYTLSGCPTGGGVYSYRLFVTVYNYYSDGSPRYYHDMGRGTSIDVKENCRITISIRFGDEIGTVNSLVFKPQLEKGSSATEYEPYKGRITEHIYLDEPLRKVDDYSDYIDFKGQRVVRKVGVSDNTGTKPISESLGALAIPTEEPIPLPALKTFKGTSIISVDTSVQPSNIKAKYVRL